MIAQTFKVTADVLASSIVNFIVGLMKITQDGGREEIVPSGSGVLVTIGSAHGILTAGHVLDCLPTRGQFGYARFNDPRHLTRRQTIDLEVTEKLMIYAPNNGAAGPDLGFLRLPPVTVNILNATNVFFNLDMKRDSALVSKQHLYPSVDAVAGVVAEKTYTRSSPSSSWAREIGVVGQFCDGKVLKQYEANGFDLIEFQPADGSDNPQPNSYQGMSGAGLWRFYYTAYGEVHESQLLGIAFCESALSGGRRTIICHGPKSIYDALYSKVIEKWPHCAD